MELNVFVEYLKYKMQFYGFSNNLSGALQILLSGHAIVSLPENYGKSLEKQYQVRKLDIDTKGRVLDQVLASNPTASNSVVANELIELMSVVKTLQ